jgi:hypothetical protein
VGHELAHGGVVMRRKVKGRGLPHFASGGQVGNEILDFQRKYNPFTGDLPTYGVEGGPQEGAWRFFDDAWLRSQIPQPEPTVYVPPPSIPITPQTFEGPDGGGADRYQDDWRGQTFAPNREIDPGQWASATALDNLAAMRGQEEPAVVAGPEMQPGQQMQSGPPAGWGYGGEDDIFAANMAAEFAPSGPEMGGRRGAPSRGPSDLTFDPLTGAATPAANTDYVPAEEYVAPGEVQFAGPLDYSPDQFVDPNNPGMNANAAPGPGGFTSIGPQDIVGAFGAAGKGMSPGDSLALGQTIENMTAGMGFGGGMPSFGEAGKVGAAALGALVDNMPTSEDPTMSMTATEALQSGSSQAKGTAAQAQSMMGAPSGFGNIASPGSPSFGAGMALAELYGLTEQDIGLGLTPGQPMEPTNTVAGPAGAPIGVSQTDPLSGLTAAQIDALAAGYHDQAPAVGQQSPVAGFETALAAAQAAAESKGRGGYSLDQDFAKGTTNTSSGGHFSGYNNNGEMVFVGSDKQGATGQDKGDTGDNGSGSGKGGGEDNAGKDSNSDTSGNSSAEGGMGGTGQGGSGDPEGAGGTGEGGQGGGKKAGGRIRGLPDMAHHLQQAGRGNDTVLAHITPKEAARLDAAMGGPQFNPETGLREYGFFDDVGDFLGGAAKAVAPIAGGVLGGMFGGPLGAAAGAALGTALTGGSLQQSLLSGGVAGIGAYAAPKMSSGLGGLFGGGNGESSNFMMDGGSGTDAGMEQGGGFLSGLTSNPLAMVGLGAAGGLGAGALWGGGDDSSPAPRTQPLPQTQLRQGTLAPRNYQPYQGDYSTYGQVGHDGGHSFYDQVNPGVQWYAEGGSVEKRDSLKRKLEQEVLYDGATNPMRLLQTAQMAMPQTGLGAPPMPQPQQPQQMPSPMGQPMQGAGQWQQQNLAPWMMAQENDPNARVNNLLAMAQHGGAVDGPGGGQDDIIPAMLSNGEYVLTATDVAHLGDGSNERGADKLDAMVKNLRGYKASNGHGLPPPAGNPMEYMSR